MRVAAVIPARLGSNRFPRKPLAPILGRPMIEHVYRRTALCTALETVVVATCDREIRDAVASFGGKAVMTSPNHLRASERVAEAAEQLSVDAIVMVQGDEPMILPEMIDASLAPLRNDPDVQCVNLVRRITDEREIGDPNCIKVVMDRFGDALYFSREPIPTRRILGAGTVPAYKQVCVIPFRAEFLRQYVRWEPTPLERTESVDMMRILENGRKVRLVETGVDTHAVDTPADLALVESLLKDDPLARRYCGPVREAERP